MSEALYNRYHDFVAVWPEHNRRGVDSGARVWIWLVDKGEITEASITEVFAGLARWKASEQWQKDGGKYIPAIADFEKHGWLQKRAWKDTPAPAQIPLGECADWSKPYLLPRPTQCAACGDSGFVSKEVDGYTYAVTCRCRMKQTG